LQTLASESQISKVEPYLVSFDAEVTYQMRPDPRGDWVADAVRKGRAKWAPFAWGLVTSGGATEYLAGKAIYGLTALAKTSQVAKTTVYISRNADDVVQYVGITDKYAARAAAHLRLKGINIEPLIVKLSRVDARAVEQALIEIHGLCKNGGTLLNKINSIALTNPIYAQSLVRGRQLLRNYGYAFK
jgi:hypothetical protein